MPTPRSSMAGSPAPSTTGALQPRKPRSSVMMSFAPGPARKASSNAFAKPSNPAAPTQKKPQQGQPGFSVAPPASTVPPASTADANSRRSLPWGLSNQQGRPSIDSTSSGRTSGASNGRRVSNSEFHFLDFFDSYRELMSVKGDENSNSDQPWRISVLAWNLDPIIKEE